MREAIGMLVECVCVMPQTFVVWVHPQADETETQSGLFEAESEIRAFSFSAVFDCAIVHV